jgi:hypothetical protein
LVSDAQFEIGDITVDVIATVEELSKTHENIQVRQMEIYSYIAALSGKSARTIRRYATVAKFYSPQTREKYAVLAFDHFETAMSYGNKWEELLDACMNQMDRDPIGKRPNADWITAYASKNYMTDYEAEMVLQTCPEPEIMNIDEVANDLNSEEPGSTGMSKAAANRFMGVLHTIFSSLEKVTSIIPVNETLHLKLESILDQLSHVIDEIQEQVKPKSD